MKTSRQRLETYLQAHHPLSAAELSQALKMTEANARHHLAVLVEQGLVEVVGQRPPQGKGRPASIYGPSRQALGDNLGHLAAAVLEELLEGRTAQETTRLLRKVAGRMAARAGAAPEKPARPGAALMTQRLYNAVQQLNGWRYQARWEAHSGAPRLILGYCPYAAILPEHPELCAFDALLLENLLDNPVEQTARLVPDGRGQPHCIFRLLPNR